MALSIDCCAFDTPDPERLGRWWADLLGWSYEVDDDGDVVGDVDVAALATTAPPAAAATTAAAVTSLERIRDIETS